jgi:uncharacterized membrane protein YedE/YeeE
LEGEKMTRIIASLVSGLIFGLGLIVSGMVNPAKVLGFLDIAGDWDPSLAFVMGGAVVVTFLGFKLLGTKPRPVFAERFHWPTASEIDSKLIVGSALFGAGWGLGGFCPGPAIASIGLMRPGTFIFIVAMVVGMIAARVVAQSGRAPAPGKT